MLLLILIYVSFYPLKAEGEEDDFWKELTFSVRTNVNGTIRSAHILWTDEFDDSFAQAYTNENKSDFGFYNDKPVPDVYISQNYIFEAFQTFLKFYQNQTKIGKVSITIPNLLEDIKKQLEPAGKKSKKSQILRYPIVNYIVFNTFDSDVYSAFFNIVRGIPDHIRVSFFFFAERTQKILDGKVLEAVQFRKTKNLDLRAIETDLNDDQFHQLDCQMVNIRSTSLTNQGINQMLKEWQDGFRATEYMKIVSDDIQKAEIMDGVTKKTLQRGTWQIRNRFNSTATVTISRIPTNFFDAQPTFEFSVN
ncbi:unnamed protein product [Caenorhabditis angaria]|uniref:F-box associated domain-containing protein n=1 Tax=Caenorhabditis angaria TaxID=860376 RepID=A0A9P1INP2_9PELO|nr:unnamed protein product [Caenorhabditis angaria]